MDKRYLVTYIRCNGISGYDWFETEEDAKSYIEYEFEKHKDSYDLIELINYREILSNN